MGMGEGVENFDEIALSPTVKEIEAFLCFALFRRKFKMAAIFEKLSAISGASPNSQNGP